MNDLVKKPISAVVTEPSAVGNENLAEVIDARRKAYDPHAANKPVAQERMENTAFIPNETDIYAYKRDDNGNQTSEYHRVFGAGWYLSVAENAVKEKILKNKANKELNEKMLKLREERGLKTRVKIAPREVRVIV